MASRAQLVAREIRPALERGEVVLLDRFFLSTYAYQIAGRGLPEHEVREANRFATGGLVPDLTLLLTLAGARGAGAGGGAIRDIRPDRGDGRGVPRARRRRVHDVRASRSGSGHPECGPIVSIDAAGSEQDVAARVQRVVLAQWPGTFPDVHGI